MATVFQTKDRKNGKPHPKWRIKYFDYQGNRRSITGYESKTETIKLAKKIEADQNAIRNGMKPPPKEADKPRAFEDTAAEYLAWGASQGGHGGRPWSNAHLKPRTAKLRFWRERLKLELIADLNGCLPRVET